MIRTNVLCCAGTGCTASQSGKIYDNFIEQIQKFGLQDEVKVVKTGCFGLCQKGPIVAIYPDKVFYSHVKPEDVERIVSEHLYKGRVVKDLELSDEDRETHEKILEIDKINFYKKQERIALRNCGKINPEDITEYIAMDGYEALGKAVTTMTPQEVIDVMKKSGLRGRGGAGFPTGVKWQFEKDAPGTEKYVICNADEGDPGAFMDRSILEGDPNAVIEGMAIMAYAVGAQKGYIYVRAEYPIAVHRLKIAIKQAEDLNLLGKNIFGSGFNFDIEIRLGAGAFVCGEETALIASIEGQRGMPRPKPPFPAVSGVWGKPTSINNVETLANVPQIINKGADWYASIGTEKSKGTKVFALGGKIRNTGLVEVPMGTTLREIIYEIGGGCPNNKEFKAVQTGGPSGGCLTEKELDTPIDYESLIQAGSMMGSGGMIVLDEDNCMVDVARFYMEFIVDESCGKCTPCRVGTKRLLEMLTKITKGEGTMEMLDEMEKLCYEIKDTALCGLGQTAPNPILSTLKHFRGEYEAHIKEKRCPAGVCKALLTYKINPDNCRKCSMCARNCPVGAITGVAGKEAFRIDPSKCIKCGTCMTVCRFGAVERS
ncbi:NADH-quinone oxidoreductase subunit NuoF [Erysipelotrichaceae bacterium Oil+RF-744-GAM-WT-6]|jgi:NADH:ubiquinone oxidoreductase subunit F (NADH-binding)/(2Fe-2S) ferredoxin/ferredoxin|uniref:NADH-quinone oxidoreductase subunit NuoF n=1 Tax=Stecheria intestinalis TaxID=2606630 RepID=A0A7X2NQH1_9FIRM|nr:MULTISPECIES: NADH-quinone oxidoreductase subunit NuoF [Erysipelotrichaceae]MCI2153197.1 NADH-quinone oxidoreductase subunit NuoF [Solobacterium sp.]MDY4681821.1 NADH-quinone oxidoreductase subunit NuoF [Lachnospiraceae bacterium]MCI6746399.1 NADH-quinone oxidoreductase subunit NuoF [Anaerolactibacter massiliensis]MDD5880573.1 NADH-quinone oxidoreductase subunit NuoF [Stecheria intestinalis]MDD6367277.1 NADH-quinone oxidoreductase subunit NuoF [Stecheria intestinalis]